MPVQLARADDPIGQDFFDRAGNYNPDDPSWFSDRYSPNFTNKWVYLFLACLLCLPVLMFLPMLNT